jgi:protein subunit release factor A
MKQTILLEIRAAEGGDDAKLLVQDQMRTYTKAALLEDL